MTLHLYILRQLAFGVALSVGGMVLIAVPGLVVNAVNTLGSVGMGAVFGYLPLIMVDLLPYMLPVGFLLTVVAIYGRLAADNEWTAMCMAGISPLKLAVPGLVVAVVLAGGTHYLVSYVSPGLRYTKRDYARQQVVERFKNLSPGRTELQLGGFYMVARRRAFDDNHFFDVIIHLPPEGDEERPKGETVLADEMQLLFEERDMVVVLKNARRIHSNQDQFVGELRIRRDLDELFKTRPKDKGWKYRPSPVVRAMIARGEVPGRDVKKAQFELHYRYSVASSCLLFLALGVPTGLILRRGTRLGALTVAVGYVLVYDVLTLRVGRALGLTEGVPAWVGAWGTTLFGLVVAGFMIRGALRR